MDAAQIKPVTYTEKGTAALFQSRALTLSRCEVYR